MIDTQNSIVNPVNQESIQTQNIQNETNQPQPTKENKIPKFKITYIIAGFTIILIFITISYLVLGNTIFKKKMTSTSPTPTLFPTVTIFLSITQTPPIQPTNIPQPTSTSKPTATSIPTPTLTTTPTPSPTSTPTPTPTIAPPIITGINGPFTGWSPPYPDSPGGTCFTINADQVIKPAGKSVEFSWRLDNNDWSIWSGQYAIKCFGDLTGSHTVEVKARIDGWNTSSIYSKAFSL